MKKTLLLLSVMAVSAFSASAYDAFTAGTDEAPNYYLIRANRGAPYLTYSTDVLENGSVGTQLYRATDASEYSLWEVTPGTEDGTVVIKNYKADAYLVGYKTGDGSEFVGETGATADVVTEPANIYTYQYGDNGFGISLFHELGYTDEGTKFYGLDATGGSSIFCGNWFSDGQGGKWWATKVDLSNADDAISAIQAAQYGADCESAQNSAIAQLQPYASVEVVADIINKGIEDIKAVKPSATCEETINNIKSQAFSAAISSLGGKTFGLLNLRRESNSRNDAYLAVNLTSNNYTGDSNMSSDNTLFEFKSVEDGGFYLYNEETATYIGSGLHPTENEAEAQTIYPILNSNGGFTGFSLSVDANHANGFNFDLRGNPLVEYSVNDGGSIWNLVVYDKEAIIRGIYDECVNHLTEYAANVEPCADICNAGLAKLAELTYSATLGDEAQAIETETLAAANDFLKTGLNQKSVQIRSLRNGYVVPDVTLREGEDTYWYAVQNAETENANYDFVSGEEGGYTVYSPVTEHYLGSGIQIGNEINMPQVDADAAAALVYPVIYNHGAFYGVAFPLSDASEPSTVGLNTNGTGLHQYKIDDPGSIFAIKIMGNSTEISEVVADEARVQGIYDLSGRKLSAPVRGINIINGRKVLVK